MSKPTMKSLSADARRAARENDVRSLASLVESEPLLLGWSNNHGNCPLAEAIKAQSVAVSAWLIERGADVHRTNEGGASILDRAVLSGNEAVVQLVLDAGAQAAPWHWAGLGRLGVLQSLSHDTLEQADWRDERPLHWASRRGRVDVIRFLLDRGVNLESENKNGLTALALAIEDSHLEAAALLLSAGADVDARGGYAGGRLLHRAVAVRSPTLVELLLANGAEVDAQDWAGKTPVHEAVMVGRMDMLEALLAAGPDLSLRTGQRAQQRDNERPIDIARRRGRTRMVERLADDENKCVNSRP